MSSLRDLQGQVTARRTTAESLVETALAKAETHKGLNIFTELLAEQALTQARSLDKRVADGEEVGQLAGIPFAVKDNFLVKDTLTTASAEILTNFKAPYTATSVQKLLDQDAILIGKTNLDAFAHGTSTENSYFGPTKNPQDPTKVAGGSSGGSAVAVAADVVPFALGTDTGGSIRLPASFCGTVGFKPSYGRISRYGVVAMASSTDCVSPLAGLVEDIELLTSIMQGRDEYDGTTFASDKLSLRQKPKAKIGLVKEFSHGLESDVAKVFQEGIEQLKSAGHEIVELSLPSLQWALACYYILVPAEISSNLSRYQGLLYGKQVKGKDWQETIAKSRSAGLMAENKRRILIGTYVLSSGYYQAYYQQAQRLRTRLIEDFQSAFEKVSCLISPVAPFTAFKIGERSQDPLKMYQADMMTVAASLAGLPAISVPLPAVGMPVGLQIMAPARQDDLVLSLAAEIKS